MIRKILLLTILLAANNIIMAQMQKPIINFNEFENWPEVGSMKWSKNSRFVGYQIFSDNFSNTSSAYIHNLSGDMIFSKPGGRLIDFSGDSNYGLISIGKDSLCVVNLKTKKYHYFPGINSGQIKQIKIGEKWKVVTLSSGVNPNRLLLLDYVSRKVDTLDQAKSFEVLTEAGTIYYVKPEKDQEVLYTYYTTNKKRSKLFNGWDIKRISPSAKNGHLAFSAIRKDKSECIYILKKAQVDYTLDSIAVPEKLNISNFTFDFDPAGEILYYTFRPKIGTNNLKDGVKIWRYDEVPLKSTSESRYFHGKESSRAYVINSRREIQITEGLQTIYTFSPDKRHVLVNTKFQEDDVPIVDSAELHLLDVATGVAIKIMNLAPDSYQFYFSPGGTCFVFFDKNKRNYFKYDMIKHNLTNITENMQINWTSYENRYYMNNINPREKPTFISESKILLSGKFDIWEFDLLNPSVKPINVTKGIGEKKQIAFSIIDKVNSSHSIQTYFMKGDNVINRQIGFYQVELSSKIEPKLYSTDDCFLSDVYRTLEGFLFYKEKANFSRNIYFTRDFKNIVQISNNRPEKNFKWFNTEMLYQEANGKVSQGILYKPDNFDPTKKYPVIVIIYEEISSYKNLFMKPSHLASSIPSIAYFLSRGYLVYTPDIDYSYEGFLNSITSSMRNSIKLLGNQKGIDTNRMALVGHSFGGYEVSLLMSQGLGFKAYLSAAGLSQVITLPFDIFKSTGKSFKMYGEKGSFRLMGDIYTYPQNYITGSPVFYLNKVNAPVLLMHGTNDENVPFVNSFELFLGMRSLGKPCWMLEYPGEIHILRKKDNILDYQSKILSFFDYTLKDETKPDWMK